MMDKLKIVIVGCGRVSIKHIKAIKKLKSRLELVALVDVSSDAPRKLIDDYNLQNVQILHDYKEAIMTLSPDIVALTVPSGLHFSMGKEILLSGCHLFLEKPMTMSSSESRELYELSCKVNKNIVMGHIYRYFPLVSFLQEDIASGKFGKVTHGAIYVRWGHDDSYYSQASWRGTWKSDGGAMMNQTIHAIDLLVWLMGSKPIKASAMLAQRLRNIEAEDLGLAILKFEDGSLASIEGTTATDPHKHEAMFHIFTSEGVINLGLMSGKPKLRITHNSRSLNGKYILKQLRTRGLSSFLEALNPHLGIYRDFISSIDDNRKPLADAYSGFSSVDTLMGIYKSAKEGREISLPLEEDFSSVDMTSFF